MREVVKWLVAPVLCAGAWCGSFVALGAEPGSDEVVRPCVEGSAEFAAARRELDSVDNQIRALRPESDHRPANDALIALMGHQCMALANIDANALRAEAAPALTEFWASGGQYWAESVLELDKRRELVLPPSMRKVVAGETRADRSALSLLCPLADADCGTETLGWSFRAQAFFESRATREPYFGTPEETPESVATLPRLRERKLATQEYCEEMAKAQPEPRQYQEWAECIASIPPRGAVMPLGRISAPKSGWLVARHSGGWVYSPCEDVRIFSLATGAAYISRRCNSNGIDKVLPERKLVLEPGSVAIDNVREAAWMMLQMRDVTVDYASNPGATHVPLEIRPELIRSSRAGSRRLTLLCSDSSVLYWALLSTEGEAVVSGAAQTPGCDEPAVDYALQLLRVIESGFVEGCPQEAPPEEMGPGPSRPVNSQPAEAPPVYAAVGILTKAFQMARAVCPDRRR